MYPLYHCEYDRLQGEVMKIRNTDFETTFPWPTDLFIQGGTSGLVIRSVEQGGNYGTAFVECMPTGTFIRGEGPTLVEAEKDCWAKYQRFLSCSGGGEHGPYEPRHYENGSGFCVKCGMWFNKVCEPSMNYRVSELACESVIARYGQDIVIMEQWKGLVSDEQARIWAAIRNEAEPVGTTEPPTPEELADYVEARSGKFAESMDQFLASLKESSD